MAIPQITGILETSLYVADVNRSSFYRDVFGFQSMFADDRLCAMSIAGKQVLLLFKQGASNAPMQLTGGVLPPHDGNGRLHLAFACTKEELSRWEAHLSAQNVQIESRIRWERGGESVYLRDPDQNLIELATPGIWPIY